MKLPKLLQHATMKLFTKNYLKFKVLDNNGSCVNEIEGFQHIKPALPGDEVTIDGTFLKHTEHPLLVGVLYLQSKVKYGMTSKGSPIYLFEPLNKAYPLMIAGSSEKPTSNMIATARFESWEPENKFPRASLIRILGPCGNPDVEKESLLLRYSPWTYPKSYTISENYDIELSKRPFIKGYTFNIDPPGCEDVDDVFTLKQISDTSWDLTISITDVASAIDLGSNLDLYAQKVGQSLYPGSTPKHMLPPKLGIKELSLLPDLLRNSISLSIRWSPSGIESNNWSLSTTIVDRAYTYKEAQNSSRQEFAILKQIVEDISKCSRITSEEWVETLMIYYNSEAGKLLKANNCGILRHHSEPEQAKLQQWISINPDLKMLAYSSASYVPSDTIGSHWGLGVTDYAHASSPLRRYADLYNQRCITDILRSNLTAETKPLALCNTLNSLQKDSKAFDRDLFFLTTIARSQSNSVKATVVEITLTDKKQSIELWVPNWNRMIRVNYPSATPCRFKITIKNSVTLQYYINYESARWKDKIVFQIIDVDTNYPESPPLLQVTDEHSQT